jgi:hypothetical protein
MSTILRAQPDSVLPTVNARLVFGVFILLFSFHVARLLFYLLKRVYLRRESRAAGIQFSPAVLSMRDNNVWLWGITRS